MPEVLRALLRTLAPEDADVVWEWLDTEPEAAHKMIEVVAMAVTFPKR